MLLSSTPSPTVPSSLGNTCLSCVCQKLGVRLGETTPDGEWTVEAVMCLAGCDKAPMFQVQDAAGIHYHESESADKPLNVDQALAVLRQYASGGEGG